MFINGQYDLPNTVTGGLAMLRTPSASPVPIARSFIQVTPQPHNPRDWDWYEGFSPGTTFPPVTESPDPNFANVQQSDHWTSSLFDIGDRVARHAIHTIQKRLDRRHWTVRCTINGELGNGAACSFLATLYCFEQ